MSAAQHVLDQVHSVARIAALESDPGQYATALAAEVPAAVTSLQELEARDAQLAAALAQIDVMIARAMRIRLEHALAGDSSIGTPTRNVFATTVLNYARDLSLLGQRARDVAARGGSRDPDGTAALVVDAARSLLDVREALRGGVLALIQTLANAAIADADRRARDRHLGDPERKRWSAARRDLEQIASDPTCVLVAPLPARLAAWPEQLDEPTPESEPTRAQLLELD